MGGPPCIDYTPVNAYRQGTTGFHGKYLLQMGHFVQALQELQGNRLYFLAENVMMDNAVSSSTADDSTTAAMGLKDQITAAFGLTWDPIQLDARDVSPCRRKRLFWTNIPLSSVLEQKVRQYHAVTPACCMQNEDASKSFHSATHWLAESENGKKAKKYYHKACVFMASKTRIDDIPRMQVFSPVIAEGDGSDQDNTTQGTNSTISHTTTFHQRTYTVLERERMMGFPQGYIETPSTCLYLYSSAFVVA